MATIRDIISSAYRYSGILNDVGEVNGNRATEAVAFLNQIIYNYNLENYLPYAQNVRTFEAGYQTYEFFNPEVPDAVPPEPVDGFGISPKVVTEEPPVRILQVSYKNGLHWSPIQVVGFAAITPYILNVPAIPSCCTYQRIKDAGFLYLNRPSLRELRVVYNMALPKVTIDDDMDAPPEYVQLFIITLAIRIARKYKLPLNDLQVLIAEKDDILNKIMDRNKDDHQILYTQEDVNPFYNILSPRGW